MKAGAELAKQHDLSRLRFLASVGEPLNAAVLGRRVPVIGLCLGMQLMTRKGTEGSQTGLGWIDAETMLVRKVFEDTPKGYPAGSYSRLTVTIEPQANATLDDGKFQFTVPTSQ